jgi:hypothetical protein
MSQSHLEVIAAAAGIDPAIIDPDMPLTVTTDTTGHTLSLTDTTGRTRHYALGADVYSKLVADIPTTALADGPDRTPLVEHAHAVAATVRIYVAAILRARGLTYAAVAEALGVSEEYVRKRLTGQTHLRLHDVLALAAVAGLDLHDVATLTRMGHRR